MDKYSKSELKSLNENLNNVIGKLNHKNVKNNNETIKDGISYLMQR